MTPSKSFFKKAGQVSDQCYFLAESHVGNEREHLK